ncbi:MAG: pyridoxamine 5'-phosphate oxidase family protein [Gammaproteobacteria bacterium]|nr:pyridoxamine 5'-phosphate oxidase family protein [Gammaproteobacteria bacterium]
MNTLFTEQQLYAQDAFANKNIARKVSTGIHSKLNSIDKNLIHSSEFFFIATSDGKNDIQCSFKGSGNNYQNGLVYIESDTTLYYPEIIGNHMMQSIGNILTSNKLGMLFINFETQQRLRINGNANIIEQPLEKFTSFWPDCHLVVKVDINQIFSNCSRNIPHLIKQETA